MVFVMDKKSRGPIHCWLVLMKAFHAAAKYLYAGLAETGIDETDFLSITKTILLFHVTNVQYNISLSIDSTSIYSEEERHIHMWADPL